MLESAGCYLLKSLLYGLGVQHIPRVEVCLFFYHLDVFLSANSKLPVFCTSHAVHEMSSLIVC